METTKDLVPPAAPAGPHLDLGAWIGKSQAFNLISKRCSAAHAECLQHIRESRAYESLNLSWDQFCLQHLGISRSWADDLICRLKEFGPGYFQLSRITAVSPDSYRQISSAVTEQGLEIDGQLINAPRIRRAVLDLRADLRRARQNIQDPTVGVLQRRFDSWFDQLDSLKPNPLDPGLCASVKGLVAYCRNKLKRLAETAPYC